MEKQGELIGKIRRSRDVCLDADSLIIEDKSGADVPFYVPNLRPEFFDENWGKTVSKALKKNKTVIVTGLIEYDQDVPVRVIEFGGIRIGR